MKSLTKKLLLIAAVLVVALGASASRAQRDTKPANRDGQKYYRMSDLINIEGIDVQQTSDTVTAMTAHMKNGKQIKMRPQSDVSCATSCPAGQHLVCWEDAEQLMSICVCKSGFGLTGSRIAPPF